MPTLLIESAIRATLIAAVVALVLFVMRIKNAAARHAVWASVVVLMMLLPVWVAWGPKASLPVLPAESVHKGATLPVLEYPVTASVPPLTTRAEPQASTWNWSAVLFGAYLLGAGTFLTRLGIGTVQVSCLLRRSVPCNGRLTHASCATPITVGWLRPKVILPADWQQWPRAKREAVEAHEGEHIRRRDPLFQWLALLNRALFWFHPLAWWLERRLSGLAEEACDAAVLSQGHDPGDYSECLLDLARVVQLAGTRVRLMGMAMPGSYLSQRVKKIITGVSTPRISRTRMASTASICAISSIMFAAGSLDHIPQLLPPEVRPLSVEPAAPLAQTEPAAKHPFLLAQAKRAATPPSAPVFDVTSVKAHLPGTPPSGEALGCSNGRFVSNDSRLGSTILWAYDLKPYQVLGEPDWIVSAYSDSFYDIEAKTP